MINQTLYIYCQDLASHFTNLDGDALKREWPFVRQLLTEMLSSSCDQVMKMLAYSHQRTVPNFSILASSALVLAASSAG